MKKLSKVNNKKTTRRKKIRSKRKNKRLLKRDWNKFLTRLFAEGNYVQLLVPKDEQYQSLLILKVVENVGGGDCLFASIYQYLEDIMYYPLPEDEQEVRMLIVNYVIANWETYAMGLMNYEEEVQQDIDDSECQLGILNMKECQAIYKNYMEQEGVYGTALELAAASHLFDFTCYMLTIRYDDYGDGTETLVITAENDEEIRRPFFLMFDGDPMEGHFQFMKPVTLPLHTVPDRIPKRNYELETIENFTRAYMM